MLRMLISLSITLLLSSTLCHSAELKFYWSVPTQKCLKFNVTFKEIAGNYGMIEKGDPSMNRDKLVYLTQYDKLPSWLDSLTGLPDDFTNTSEFTGSLKLFQYQVDRLMPNFNGLAVIHSSHCVEHLRRAVVTPGSATPDEINIRLNKEKYLKLLMEATLKLARDKQPAGHYGYTDCPDCLDLREFDGKISCYPEYEAENDRMSWLWKNQNIIFLSILVESAVSNDENLKYLTGQINEAKRIVKHYNTAAKVVPYFHLLDREGNQLEKTLFSSLFEKIVDHQFDEVILVGYRTQVDTAEKCGKLHQYLNQIVGPAVIDAQVYANHHSMNSVNNSGKVNNNTTTEHNSEESTTLKVISLTTNVDSRSMSQLHVAILFGLSVWAILFLVLAYNSGFISY